MPRPRGMDYERNRMLVLNRKPLEKIIIGDDIKIMVVEVRRDGTVRIGVDAPKELSVHREEVYEAIQRERKQNDNN